MKGAGDILRILLSGDRNDKMHRMFPVGLLFLKKLKAAPLLFMPRFFILLLGGKEHEGNQSRPHPD